MHRRASLALALSLSPLTLIACSGSDGGSPASGDGQNATSAQTVFACKVDANQDQSFFDAFKLTLVPGKSAVVEASDIPKSSGKLDTKFKPKANTDFDRYLVNGLTEDGVSDLLVAKDLTKAGHGTVKVEAKGEVFDTANYSCAAAGAASAPPSSGHGKAAPPEIKGSLRFTCSVQASSSQSFPDKVTIELSAASLSLSSEGPNGISGKGPFDPAFKPKNNTSFVRYNLNDLVDEATSDVLVEKPLLEGKAGRLKIEATDDTFTSNTYDCTPK
jgi:hypothetical protein